MISIDFMSNIIDCLEIKVTLEEIINEFLGRNYKFYVRNVHAKNT